MNLCGERSENCPQGLTTGDAISPAAGYDGGGALQHVTSVAIDQAGNVWAANNVNDPEACARMSETGCRQASTECGGDGVVVFFGLAAPVDAPMIGPPRQPKSLKRSRRFTLNPVSTPIIFRTYRSKRSREKQVATLTHIQYT